MNSMNTPMLNSEPGSRQATEPDDGLRRILGHPLVICLALAAMTLGVFWPVLKCDFTNYDDPEYFWSNSHVLSGLTWENVAWAFQTACSNNWHPLTWLSFMLDVKLFGTGPAGPHFINLLLHVANTVLLFLLLRRLTGTRWRSALVAGLFALHPLHVESVAWISERKDVLSTLFWLLTLWAYSRYAAFEVSRVKGQGGPKRWYGLALLFFALGLLSKPMVVTLPFVMLLLDYWPLGRVSSFKFQVSSSETPTTADARPSTLDLRLIWRLVWEKGPFFVLSAISCGVTVWAQKKGGLVITLRELPVGERIANAFVSYVRYLGKTFWPVELAVFYPHPEHWAWRQVLLATVLVVGLCAAAVWLGRRRPYVFAGWFWFWGTLIPVIGLVQVGAQSMADRYAYVPLIGIFIILVWSAGEMALRWQRLKFVMSTVAVLVLCACALRTRDQLRYWQNGEVLSRRALAVTKDNELAYNNLGYYLFVQGHLDEAMDNFRHALQIAPNHSIAQCNLGIVLAAKGELDEAIPHFMASLRSDPNYTDAHVGLADVLVAQGKFAEAIQHYAKALELEPDSALTHNKLGNALAKLGRLDEAMAHYAEAVRLQPDYAEAHNNLGNILAMKGELDKAIVHFQAALQYKPDYASAHSNLGVILAAQGKYAEAIPHYAEALNLEPASALMHNNLGYALMEMGRLEEAVGHFKEALRLNPNDPKGHFYLGSALVRLGRREKAIEQLTEALRLKPDYAEAKKQLQALGVQMSQ